jgi:hypothetical protein
MPIKVLIPKDLLTDPKKMLRAVKNGLDAAAKGAEIDLKVTTQTWNHKPGFSTDSSQDDRRIVGTDDDIYGYVSGGTRPHIITAHGKALAFQTGYRAKTRPRVIGSEGGGASGPTVYRQQVMHPGTKAREFDKAIAEKWQQELPTIMQRAIDSEI